MIGFLRGHLLSKAGTEIVVECQGVGYELLVSLNTAHSLNSVNSEVAIFTKLLVREDALQLVGFATLLEKATFEMLVSVSGIGARIAIGILSQLECEQLLRALAESDLRILQSLNGIGKKTAERMVVEIREKALTLLGSAGISSHTSGSMATNSIANEAVMALQTLGYSKASAERAVGAAIKEARVEVQTSDELIRFALKQGLNN